MSLSTFHSVPNKQESYSSDTELSTCCATLLGSPENECKVPQPKQRQPWKHLTNEDLQVKGWTSDACKVAMGSSFPHAHLVTSKTQKRVSCPCHPQDPCLDPCLPPGWEPRGWDVSGLPVQSPEPIPGALGMDSQGWGGYSLSMAYVSPKRFVYQIFCSQCGDVKV